MATYFIDPYKKYYDELSGAPNLKEQAATLSEKVEFLKSRETTLESQLSSAIWKELGFVELINMTAPLLKSQIEALSESITNSLIIAVNTSVDNLLPIVKDLKIEDENYEKINAKIAEFGEEPDQYETVDGEKKVTQKYNSWHKNVDPLKESLGKIKVKCEDLITKADAEVNKINGTSQNAIEKAEVARSVPKQITNSSATNIVDIKLVNDDGVRGRSYVILTMANGKTFKVYDQIGYPNISKGGGKVQDMRGGCSYFSLTSFLGYLTQNPDIDVESVVRASAGQFFGLERLMGGKDKITLNGTQYTVESDISQKKTYGGNKANEDAAIADIEYTLKNGGAVILNYSGLKNAVNLDDGTRVGTGKNIETGITSKNGHMVAMVGLTPEGKIIWADSICVGKDNKYYDKGITVEEFVRIYGGRSPTNVPQCKSYYTATYAELKQVSA